MSYYYLISQLPALKFAEESYITRDVFLEQAFKCLDAREFEILKNLDINNIVKNSNDAKVLKDYKDFELAIRRQLAAARLAIKAKNEFRVSRGIAEALAASNPLEAEKKLLFLRWRFIEEKETGKYFSFDAVLFYFLKIQILEKIFAFNKEKGLAIFDTMCGVGKLSH